MADTNILEAFKDNNIDIDLSIHLGSANLKINQILKLGRGAVVELDHTIEDQVDIYANNVLIGHGEIVITNNEYIGVSITEIFK